MATSGKGKVINVVGRRHACISSISKSAIDNCHLWTHSLSRVSLPTFNVKDEPALFWRVTKICAASDLQHLKNLLTPG